MIQEAEKTQQALALFQQGDAKNAKNLLEEICDNNAENDFAWFLLATIHFQTGSLAWAKQFYQNAVKINPENAEAWNNLGVTQERLHETGSARQAYENAIKIRPRYTSALFHLGNLLQQQNEFETAKTLFKQALETDPDNTKILNNLAVIFEKEKNYEQALDLLQQSLSQSPNDLDVLNNMGFVLNSLEKYQEAIPYIHRAIELQKDSSVSYNNLGISQLGLGQYDNAIDTFEHALNLAPGNVDVLTNLAICFENKALFDRAIETYNKALTANSSHAPALNGIGAALKHQGKIAEACDAFKQAIEIEPTYSDARYNLATTQLGMGRYKQGFDNYRARPSLQTSNSAVSTALLANDLSGKRILLLKDQGIGDELFFLRYIQELKRRGAYIYYLPNEKTASLIKHVSDIDCLVSEHELPDDIDISLSVADLPYITGIQDDSILKAPLCLQVDDTVAARLKQELASLGPAPYIGLTWRGGLNSKRVLFKEIGLSEIARSLSSVNATFIVLQRDPAHDELSQLAGILGKPVHDFSAFNNDLPKMLALLSLLDDYIGVSNTNMHMLAGIGQTARVLVPHPPEWRWQAGGKHSPWFPGFEIYRQDLNGGWDSGINELKQDLEPVFSNLGENSRQKT